MTKELRNEIENTQLAFNKLVVSTTKHIADHSDLTGEDVVFKDKKHEEEYKEMVKKLDEIRNELIRLKVEASFL